MSSFNFPVVITSAGLQAQSTDSLRQQLIDYVNQINPGYTADLPGSLIEDISSTDVGAMALIDRARVELVNSLTPYGANDFLLGELGAQTGIVKGQATNTTVDVVFTGTVGYSISPGFIVSDGTHQYQINDGGVIGSSGSTSALTATATQSGYWAIPPNTVSQLVTSVPGSITLSVTNPLAGTPSSSAETSESYRSRILQAQLAASQGMPRYLKSLVTNVKGVVPRLVAVDTTIGSGIKVIVGGGDNYEVANAIFQSAFDPSQLLGSVISVTNFTAANPGQVTTDLNHGLATGATATIAGADPTAYNGSYTITVVDEKNFTVGVDTSSYGVYVGGGTVSPNNRNVTVSINDYPDTYQILFVDPPEQTVAMTVTWNTSLPDFSQAAAIAQLAPQPLADYINGIYVGAPINVLELNATFQSAIASVLDADLVTKLVFAVTINGIATSVTAGTQIIEGDPESYFSIATTDITVTQG